MRRLPAYCIHKSRNLAYMTLGGREVYLGRAHSPESHAKYREALSALLAGLPPTEAVRTNRKPSALTVAELAERGNSPSANGTGNVTNRSTKPPTRPVNSITPTPPQGWRSSAHGHSRPSATAWCGTDALAKGRTESRIASRNRNP